MVLDIKKLFTKGSTVGRFEYLKTVYGLLLFPSLLLYLAVLTPPNNILSYPIIIIALIVLIPYSAIYWVATYKRFNNIFDNGVISTISLIVFIFSIRFRIFRLILDLLLVLVPGKKKSDNITSSKLFWIAIPLVVIMFITARYIGFNRYIASGAMDNTLIKNDRIIINVFDKDYKRGDIIAHQANKAVYVKRIIGLPGEKVEIKKLQDGSYGVYINGKMLDEPYVKNVYDYPKLSSMPNATMVVPNDSYYVVGDNRGNSLDSRYYGAVKKDIIKGKVSHIWFPLNRRQVFTTPEYSFNE